MAGWEYKVKPAPTKGVKGKGVKGPEGRFANALEVLMNDMAGEGWEFQRAETLPSIERAGLTGSSTEWRNVLVFRRVVTTAEDDFEPELLPAPDLETEDAPDDPADEADAEEANEGTPVYDLDDMSQKDVLHSLATRRSSAEPDKVD